MSISTIHVDIAVIGAGTAGMHAYHTAKRAGAMVVLIDHGPLGTTCARTGCMPSKAVLHAAHRWSTLQALLPEGGAQALPAGHTTPQQLWAQALSIRDQLVQGNVRHLEKLAGDDLLRASARFVAPDVLELDDGRHVHARAFVVATGSEGVKPESLQAELGTALLTSDELFFLPELPRSVAIMGTGAIGLEMGVALSRLGVNVVAAGRSASVAKVADPEVGRAATRYFSAQLPLALGASDIRVVREGNGVCMQAGTLTHRAQYLLAALGRRPRLGALNVEAAQVQLDEKGRPRTEKGSLRCAGTMVFVAGDPAPSPALMHEAGHDGTLAAQQALKALGDGSWKDMQERHRTVPLSIVFTDPDIAEVGLRFDQLPADALIGRVDGAGSGRSKLMQAPHHLLHLYADRHSGQMVGASMFCARGEHLAHSLAWAIQRGETVDSLLELPFYHPTLEEMIDTALRNMRHEMHQS